VETDVYRLYAGVLEEDLTLLYVGISIDARVRLVQHYRKPWWPLVTYAEVNRYLSREVAEIAEAAVIREEHPIFNIAIGSYDARCGDSSQLLHFEVGYTEFHIGWTDEQWAA